MRKLRVVVVAATFSDVRAENLIRAGQATWTAPAFVETWSFVSCCWQATSGSASANAT